ncbi:MAG: hypothetical protein L6Q92_12175 [Phycisphaerae bacterium]|nr:hypothetical protein [Phycisphaerae bacterium]
MLPDIKPGTMVTLEMTRNPRSERAAKTLSRLFAKDAATQRAARQRKKIRTQNFDPRRRGGRIWIVRPHAPRIVMPMKGASCTIRATTDVIRDLGSVAHLLKISPR